jgi:hypothetical protein
MASCKYTFTIVGLAFQLLQLHRRHDGGGLKFNPTANPMPHDMGLEKTAKTCKFTCGFSLYIRGV